MRWDLTISQFPSEPKAGVIAWIPDGGILPRPGVDPVVIAGGKTLLSEILWHNPGEGLGIIFEPPSAGNTVAVYLRAAAATRYAGNTTAFYPSVVLYTCNTPLAGLDGAHQLGSGNKLPGTDVIMGVVPFIGQRMNLYGLDDNYISYYSGWIRQDKQAKIYFCTISDEGSELRVDDRVVASWPGIHTRKDGIRGEYGSWVDLSPGMHRVEYFHFEKTGDQEAQALWTMKPITKDHKPTTIPANAYIRSGMADIAGFTARDGRPVPVFSAECQGYFWFLNKPVNLFRFKPVMPELNPPDTTYTWTVGNEAPVTTNDFAWLVEGSDPMPVTLVASSTAGSQRASRRVTIWTTRPGTGQKTTPREFSVNSSYDRETYRDVFLKMCRVVPAGKNPCGDWSPDLWATLLNVVEPYKGGKLLLEIFERSRGDVRKLKEDDRWYLEDLFFEIIRHVNIPAAAKWLDRLEEEEKDRERKYHWKITRVDFLINNATNLVEARKQVAILQSAAANSDETVLSMIRMGDVERASGNYEEAAKYYSLAQDRYRAMARNKPVNAALRQAMLQGGPTKTKEQMKARRKVSSPVISTTSIRAPEPTQTWKTFAVHEAMFLVTARTLIKDGYFFEARDVLNTWEMEYPLCKLKGDYPLAEADYYSTAGLYERALRILQVYKAGVDISSSMPDALGMELKCLKQLGRKNEAMALAKDIMKKFPNHPAGEEARRLVEYDF